MPKSPDGQSTQPNQPDDHDDAEFKLNRGNGAAASMPSARLPVREASVKSDQPPPILPPPTTLQPPPTTLQPQTSLQAPPQAAATALIQSTSAPPPQAAATALIQSTSAPPTQATSTPSQSAPELYRASLIRRIQAATALGVVRTLKLGGAVEDAAEKTVKGIIRFLRSRIINALINKLRDNRLLEKLDFADLPQLIPGDTAANTELAADISDFLDSPIGRDASFFDEIVIISRHAFRRGIPPEKLIDYFNDERLMDMMIKALLGAKEARFRGSDLYALLKSSYHSVIVKLKGYAERRKQKKVDAELDEQLKKNIASFGASYDPKNRRRPISRYVRDLQAKYPDYDILGWLKKNQKLLREIFAGTRQPYYDPGKLYDPAELRYFHVVNTIKEAYEICGRDEPETFIKLHLAQFLSSYLTPAGPAHSDGPAHSHVSYLTKELKKVDRQDEKAIVLDLPAVLDFFTDNLTRLETKENPLVKLRGMLADICIEFIRTKHPQAKTLLVISHGTRDKLCEATAYPDNQALIATIPGLFADACGTISSHIDVANLLEDPDSISPEIRRHHERWYEEKKFNNIKYYRDIRTLFGHTSLVPRDKKAPKANGEGLEVEAEEKSELQHRIQRLFVHVNNYLEAISKDLGIPTIDHPKIKDINDYAELVKIHCESSDPQERFAARRKIELASLLYSCLGTPHYVFRDQESKAVKAVLKSSPEGIRIRSDRSARILEFMENDEGEIRIVENRKGRKAKRGETKHSVDLIPARFAQTECYLLPTQMEEKGIADSHEYLSQKSLDSMLIKLLSGEKKRAKDLSDLLRMTFIVDDIKKLEQIQRYIENNHISFGRVIKTENRYGHIVREASLNVSPNPSKAEDYRTLRYVVDIPVTLGEAGETYLVPVEIRIMLTEDLCKERSKNHPASHCRYENRRLRRVFYRVVPPQIFPEFYKCTKPDPYDIYGDTEIVPKEAGDYQKAA